MAQGQTTGSSATTYDVAGRKDVDLLHAKAVGLIGVLFLTVTGAAPISAMLFNVPVAVGFGDGIGAPAAFLFATIVLLIFSVGYAAMAGKVTAVGGFYSFISHGLGRELGMAMGFASVVAYSVFEASLCGGFAYFMNLKILDLTGANVGWPYLALFMVGLIAVLTYFDVKLSTWVLGIALIGEVFILVVFDLGIFTNSAAHIDVAAINPLNAFNGFPKVGDLAEGAAAIGLFFAFWSWVGFEMAPNYGEELRDPKRIVPLSLYISVLGLGIFYIITSWASISAYPTIDDAIKISQTDSAHYFLTPATTMVGGWVGGLMSYLILTGSFACGMAFHNTAARYFYSLGRERVFPAALGKTHPVYKSPYVASFTQSVIAAIIIVLFWIFAGGNDPERPGLCHGLRPAGGDGDDADPVRPGSGFRRDHRLLPEEPSGGASLVEHVARTSDLLRCADLCDLSDDLADGVPRRRIGLGRLDTLDQSGRAGSRDRRRVLPQDQRSEEIRSDRAAHLPGRSRQVSDAGDEFRTTAD